MLSPLVMLGVATLLGQTPASGGPERVVLIGGTMVERDQSYGYLETRWTRRFPGRSITFRNLGWSGDTVEGISRARFGTQADGFKHLVDHVLALNPTVIVLGYGANEAFAGRAGLPAFLKDLDKLLAALAPSKARLIFLGPTPQEDLGRPLPDPAAHNADLALYRDALKAEAERRGATFVDLLGLLPAGPKGEGPPGRGPKLTDNGIHLNPAGYSIASAAIEKALFGVEPARDESGESGETGKVSVQLGLAATIKDLEATPTGVRFQATLAMLPDPKLAGNPFEPSLRVANLAPGRYALKVDGKAIESRTRGGDLPDAAAWKGGVVMFRGPNFDQVETLRKAINAKNALYFHRWRPENETYLFGFRKHEQGRNAAEIVAFDPLIAEKEAEIARLRVPAPHVYELTREGEVAR